MRIKNSEAAARLYFNSGALGLPPRAIFAKHGRQKLIYTTHAKHEAITDYCEGVLFGLPASVDTGLLYDGNLIVEAEICKKTGQVLKYLARIPSFNKTIVLVIGVENGNLNKVFTTYTNNLLDNHTTLARKVTEDGEEIPWSNPKNLWKK